MVSSNTLERSQIRDHVLAKPSATRITMAIVMQDNCDPRRLRPAEAARRRKSELVRAPTATGIAQAEVERVPANGGSFERGWRLGRVRLANVAHNPQRKAVAVLVHSRRP